MWILKTLEDTMRLDIWRVTHVQSLEERLDLHDALLVMLLVQHWLREVVDFSQDLK